MSFILNIALLVLGIIGCILELADKGKVAFKYYTFNSNVLGTAAAAVMVAFQIIEIVFGISLPYAAVAFKYVATCSLTLTLIIVLLVLAPMSMPHGYFKLLLTGPMLYQHLLCPVLAIGSFLLIDGKFEFPLWITFIALGVTLLYGIVLIILVSAEKVIAPYPFLEVKNQSMAKTIMWFITIFAIDYAFIWGLWWLY